MWQEQLYFDSLGFADMTNRHVLAEHIWQVYTTQFYLQILVIQILKARRHESMNIQFCIGNGGVKPSKLTKN